MTYKLNVIWGGFKLFEGPYYSDMMLKITTNAGTSSLMFFMLIEIMYYSHIWIMVKIMMTWGQSAVVKFMSFAIQRTNAENTLKSNKYIKNNHGMYNDLFYAYLSGLIDSNGWIKIKKTNKYLQYELGIELNIRDIKTLYKIKDLLGVGMIKTQKRMNSNNIEIELAIYLMRNKNHLKEMMIPMFDKYPLLTLKHYDYLYFKHNLLNNMIYYKDIQTYQRSNIPIYTINEIINKDYFPAWLIGFMEAKSSFGTYKVSKDNMIAYFEMSQNKDMIIIEAIKMYFNITNSMNNYKLRITSIEGINNMITFMDKNPMKLLGYKKMEYLLFLKTLRRMSKYKNNINMPNKY
ncbi:putative intron-encoded endonuclease (mitochondrion) [[Candida] railenensis]|uniref:putative intron-encoded endonuclease n=1 Tax=[Candida] railenensis TaxID=45579 RepID=UPI0020292C97|nr:putative intron-encoded endonuclease [[Candida] railenensis]CAH2356113.1 putative intron-encoded endonuclease [[Candida] railenensis]